MGTDGVWCLYILAKLGMKWSKIKHQGKGAHKKGTAQGKHKGAPVIETQEVVHDEGQGQRVSDGGRKGGGAAKYVGHIIFTTSLALFLLF